MTRGGLVESVHAASACACDARGASALELGDVATPVFLRSAAKPLIAAAVVASGAAERYGFTPAELAVAAASHDGEPVHVAAVEGILAKLGLDAAALRCGAALPSSEPAAEAVRAGGGGPSPVYHNCSGKHAAILAMCAHRGWDLEGYREPGHPAQRAILALCARAVGLPEAALPLGVDGCGIPVFAAPLRAGALAFARIAALEGLPDADLAAIAAVRAAMIAEPVLVAGSARFDTALLRESGGTVVAKAGAEGVHADALVPHGLGLALKVVDGARRAVPPATLAYLDALGALVPGALERLAPFAAAVVRNAAGAAVGTVEALPGVAERAVRGLPAR